MHVLCSCFTIINKLKILLPTVVKNILYLSARINIPKNDFDENNAPLYRAWIVMLFTSCQKYNKHR